MFTFISWSLLAAFIPTFFFVSITPGMCMTLSMTLGISIGIRRTMWMMAGELIGVGIVAICSVVGVATLMLKFPVIFIVLKLVGGSYLLYLGIQMWLSKGKLALSQTEALASQTSKSRISLASQGFITAIANPKGWAFFISLFPPFIDSELPVWPQIMVLLFIVLCLEFTSLMVYASGGSSLRRLLKDASNVKIMNRISGSLMIMLGFWLVLT